MPWRYHIWRTSHEATLKPSFDAQTVSKLKVALLEDKGQFSAGPINKAVPSFTHSLTRVRER